MNKEEWRNVVGYEGHYKVSDRGRVRSLDRIIKDKVGRTKFYEGQELSQFIDKSGYPMCTLWRDSNGKNKTVHRIVAGAFIPNPNNKPQVNHKDGNKENNHVDNLEWVTNSENDLHAFEIGLRTVRRGSKSNLAKLTEEEVLKIREFKESGETQRNIAKIFDISEGSVSQIVNRKRWAWLE